MIGYIRRRILSWYERHTDAGYWHCAKKYYYSATGKKLDYRHPKDLNEKLMWLERYWQHPLKTICSDKYQVRHYITQHGMSDTLVPLIGVWDKVEDIDFSALPIQFVLKCNHGSGYNIICHDKSRLDIEATKLTLNQWMSRNFDKVAFEIHYRAIPHKILCEQLISQTAPLEYQIWCVNGKAHSFLVCRKNLDETYDAWSYSLDWKPRNDRKEESAGEPPKPHDIQRLIRYAELLAEPFPFIRVDFYEVDKKIYFAEMTFSPASNILSAYKDEYIQSMGDKLFLPRPWPPTDWKKWKEEQYDIRMFVDMMNKRALEIGMRTAHFDDPSGLSYLNTGTAYDVIRLMEEVLQEQGLVAMMNRQKEYIWRKNKGGRPRRVLLENTLHFDDFRSNEYKIIAAKTGSDGYIYNVIIAVEYNGYNYVLVVLNASTEQRRTMCVQKLLTRLLRPVDSTELSFKPSESILLCKVMSKRDIEEIYAHNAELVVPLLSVTKILSAIIVYQNRKRLHRLIKIHSCDIQRGSGIPLKLGAIMSSKAAMYSALITSSNTAIYALARNIGRILRKLH